MRARKIVTDWTGQVQMLPGPKLIELEKDTQEQIRLAVAAAGGVYVMRNAAGRAKHGRTWVKYGLGVGSADLICVVAPHGRFLGIEIKRPKGGKVSPEQERWMKWIRLYGGVTGVAKNIAEAMALVAEARNPPAAT